MALDLEKLFFDASFSKRIELTNPSRSIAYVERPLSNSAAQSTPVVFLHGFMDNAASFVPLFKVQVWKSDARLIAFDFSGHGFSSNGSRQFYGTMEYALDIVDALRELHVDRLILVGHSLGGGVAALVATALGEKVVEKLVMIDTLGSWPARARDVPRLLQESAAFVAASSAPHANINAAAEHRAKKNFVGTMQLDDALLLARRGTVPVKDGGESAVVWNYDPYLKRTSPIRMTPDQSTACVNAIAVPTLVLLANDGLFKAMFSPIGRLLTSFGFVSSLAGLVLSIAVRLAQLVGIGAWKSVVHMEMACLFSAQLRRLRARGERSVAVRVLDKGVDGGGHHIHMRYAGVIYEHIEKFIQRN